VLGGTPLVFPLGQGCPQILILEITDKYAKELVKGET
jgi:hypothetical protein